MPEFEVTQTDFRDYFGKLLWSEPMIYSRLHAVGEVVVEKGKYYKIRRVAVADNIQHVNFEARNP